MSKGKRKRRAQPIPARSNPQGKTAASPHENAKQTPRLEVSVSLNVRALLGAVMLLAGAISYWPNFVRFLGRWIDEPDYSHGVLVIPFIAYCLFQRRGDFPPVSPRLAWGGMTLISIGAFARVMGGGIYIEAVEDWSILVWVGGCVWLLFGWRCFLWSLPFVGFLFFMIPLPFRLEEALALPLQGIATKLSTWTLQLLGQPALDQGNTISLGSQLLGVERACSGLRIFMSMVAVGVAVVMLSPERPPWQKAMLFVCSVPIAIVANVTRIVVTGLLYQYGSGKAAKAFSHDFAGFAMIIYAIGLFWLLVWYLDQLFPEVQDAVAPRRSQRRQTQPT